MDKLRLRDWIGRSTIVGVMGVLMAAIAEQAGWRNLFGPALIIGATSLALTLGLLMIRLGIYLEDRNV